MNGPISRSQTPKVQVIIDGADPNTASVVQGYAQGVLNNWASLRAIGAVRAAPGSGLEDRMWFNPERSSRYFLVPGSVATVMALVGTLLTARVVAREWERGTMEALMATPVTAPELLLGKVLPYFLLGLGSMSLCASIAVFVFHVPFRGSVPALFAISSAFLLPSLGQGLLISASAKNQFLAHRADGDRAVGGSRARARHLRPFSEVAQNTVPLFFIAAVTLSAAAWLFRKRIE